MGVLGESMTHSENTRSRKPWLSTIERGHHVDIGDTSRARPRARFPGVKICVDLTKSFENEAVNRGPVCIICRHERTLKIMQSNIIS